MTARLKFEQLPRKDEYYIAFGDNGKTYGASYSRKHETLFMAIPKGVTLLEFCPLTGIPDIKKTEVDEIEIGEVYFFPELATWGKCIGIEKFISVCRIDCEKNGILFSYYKRSSEKFRSGRKEEFSCV